MWLLQYARGNETTLTVHVKKELIAVILHCIVLAPAMTQLAMGCLHHTFSGTQVAAVQLIMTQVYMLQQYNRRSRRYARGDETMLTGHVKKKLIAVILLLCSAGSCKQRSCCGETAPLCTCPHHPQHSSFCLGFQLFRFSAFPIPTQPHAQVLAEQWPDPPQVTQDALLI